jgi:hypothetical protein
MKENTIIKKATRELVYNKIQGALTEMKAGVKEKKFSKKLKKASKILAKDISKVIEKAISKKASNDKKFKKNTERANAKASRVSKKAKRDKKEKFLKPGKINNPANAATNPVITIPVTDSVN